MIFVAYSCCFDSSEDPCLSYVYDTRCLNFIECFIACGFGLKEKESSTKGSVYVHIVLTSLNSKLFDISFTHTVFTFTLKFVCTCYVARISL